MIKNILILLAAMALLCVLTLVGTLMQLILKAPYGSGGLIAWIIFVFVWYNLIRRNKNVWQPGKRFWKRWVFISIAGLIVSISQFGAGHSLVFVAGIANLLWFVFDAFKNFNDVSTET